MLPPMGAAKTVEPFLVVHADATDPAAHPTERAIIEAGGGRLAGGSADTEEERGERLRDADIVLSTKAPLTRTVIEHMQRARAIVRYGVGLDNVDLPAATEHGIVVAHFPDFCQPEVANHAIMLLLACAKKLIGADRAVRDGRWRPGPLSPMGSIHGETLGLVAFGNIAQAVAPRAQALGLNVIAHDPYVEREVFERLRVERVQSLEELLGRSDYVSVHTPLAPATRHLLGRDQFTRMKRSAYIINTSRGAVIDERALIEALEDGEIAGAGLDVFEQEPLPADSPLTEMENVVLTAHSASYSDPAFESLRRRVAHAAVDVMEGRRPEFVANPKVVPQHGPLSPRP